MADPKLSRFGVIKETFKEFSSDDCSSTAGALAYFTVLSLPPLLVVIVAIAGFIFGREAVQGEISAESSQLIGPAAARTIEDMIENAFQRPGLSSAAGFIGLATLLLSATGAFMQLQRALNKPWEVAPDPEQGGIRGFVFKRLLSFGMILMVAFLMLVSLVISAAMSAFGDLLADRLPTEQARYAVWGLNLLIPFGIIAFLFATIFKYLPDAEISWRQVWIGGVFTAQLFVIGKFALGFYLGKSDPGSTYGAAGSLIIVLIWIYYSSLILLLGAEFTQVWACRHGAQICPSPGAFHIVRETRTA